MLGAFLLQRRSMLEEIGGWDAGYRHYVEDIDLCYRAMRAGWERWYVPEAVVRHAYAAVIDRRFLSRHTLWHLRGHGAVRSQAPGAADGAVSDKESQYARGAPGWSDAQYADTGAYLAHRADLVATLGPALHPGDEVLDLACGDGGLGAYLLERGFHYRGVDATPEMVAAAVSRLGSAASLEVGDMNEYAPPRPVAATTVFRAIYYARDRREFLRRVASFTTVKVVLDLNPRQYAVADVVGDLRAAGLTNVVLHPFFVPQTVALPRVAAAALRAVERSGPLARLLLRRRFTYIVAASRI